VVLDPQKAVEHTVRRITSEAEDWRTKVRAVQVTKADIIAQNPKGCFRAEELPAVYGQASVPIFFSSLKDPATLLQGICHILSLAA
jgi:hypothetical protein